jgi:hypothetical protein
MCSLARACRLMRLEDIDGMRRSLVIGGSLSRGETERLLDACQALLAQRVQIAAVLADLPESVGALRAALNRLHRLVS